MECILKEGDLIKIDFLDHCISPEHIILECHVVGWVISQDEKRLTISYWETPDFKDHREPVNILKSTIEDISILIPMSIF